MSTPLTDEQLQAIKERAATTSPHLLSHEQAAKQIIKEDVPALLGEVERLRERDAHIHEELRDRRSDDLNMRGILSPSGEERKVPFELGPTIAPAVEWLVAEVERLKAEQAEQVTP